MKPLKACVIGSGFGGLAVAIRLQAAGFQTTILEKRDKPGGRAYVYKDKGFTFDAGPTVITAPHCLEELFAACGERIEDHVDLMPVTPFYRLFWEDAPPLDYSNDLASLEKQILKRSPQDWPGYQQFAAYSEAVFKEGYEKLAHVPFLNFSSMVKVAPQLIQLKAYRSVHAQVAKYIRDPHLRQAFSFHSLLVGGNPFASSAIYTLIHFLERKWGVTFPRGGTGELIRQLAALFERHGGKLRLNTGVRQILSNGKRVTGVQLEDGREESYDLVVSNADVVTTYRELLREEPKVASAGRRLARSRMSMSLFLIYFGTNRKYPNMAHHNVLFGPRYRELLDDIFHHQNLADDFSLYLHAPTVTDPALAPPGCEAFYVLSPVPHLGKGNIDWKTEGPRYADRILKYLEDRYLPGLSESIVTKRIFTPLDFKEQLGSHLGSAFSLEPILTQSAYFRAHNREDRLRGLYFVGAGTHPGAGVPGVVGSAKATFSVIDSDRAGLQL